MRGSRYQWNSGSTHERKSKPNSDEPKLSLFVNIGFLDLPRHLVKREREWLVDFHVLHLGLKLSSEDKKLKTWLCEVLEFPKT